MLYGSAVTAASVASRKAYGLSRENHRATSRSTRIGKPGIL